jgi:DNA-binding NarL/FixJ family response regulator
MEQNGHNRVLLVDDHEAFRRYVFSMLERTANFQVVGEAADGLLAVQLAKALQPDLILLDIGLPGINGLEAARQIGEVAGKARVIFLTQETSLEVVQEAFDLGAWGYIIKAQAGSELLPAMEAVSRWVRFLNSKNGRP